MSFSPESSTQIGAIILAGVILKERVAPIQIVGLALAIGAAALLALS
jgi:drug/metabolite transporter (DMT)-like permease